MEVEVEVEEAYLAALPALDLIAHKFAHQLACR